MAGQSEPGHCTLSQTYKWQTNCHKHNSDTNKFSQTYKWQTNFHKPTNDTNKLSQTYKWHKQFVTNLRMTQTKPILPDIVTRTAMSWHTESMQGPLMQWHTHMHARMHACTHARTHTHTHTHTHLSATDKHTKLSDMVTLMKHFDIMTLVMLFLT